MDSKHEVPKGPTVSIITRCKGRKKDLQKTLPLMLMQNYTLSEVIVVNYNSPDGLSKWMHEKYSKFIKAGKLIEVTVPDTNYFYHSHSRNVGLKAAKGDLVLFIDSDCQPVTNLLMHILQRVGLGPNVFSMIGFPSVGKSGTMLAKREDLIALGGFMDQLIGWGYEDGDMRDRLFLYGKEMFSFFPNLVTAIGHNDYERWMYFNPPLNKNKENLNWKEIERDNNYRISKEYINQHGIIANKNKPWGEGGIIREPKKRWINSSEDPENIRELSASDLKGAHILRFDKETDELLNEKEVLDAGCPPSYITEAKRNRKIKKLDEAETQQFNVQHDDNIKTGTHRGKISRITQPEDIIVDIPE